MIKDKRTYAGQKHATYGHQTVIIVFSVVNDAMPALSDKVMA